jgi:hypothetical protein
MGADRHNRLGCSHVIRKILKFGGSSSGGDVLQPIFMMQSAKYGRLRDAITSRQVMSAHLRRNTYLHRRGMPGPNDE